MNPARIAAAMEHIPLPIHAVDGELRLLCINRAFRDWLERLKLDVPSPGMPLRDAFPFLGAEVLDEYGHVLSQGEVVDSEEELVLNEETHLTHTRKYPLAGERGRASAVITVIEDLTARRRISEALQRSQRLEALGRLSGGIAHDFNNMLTTILGYARIALYRIDDKSPLRTDLEEIINAGERAGELTGQLLSFGRRSSERLRPVDVNYIVQQTHRLLRRILGEDIEIAARLGNRLGGVMIDSGQLQQVILNLGINARDAMPQGGTIRIVTEAVELDAGFCGDRPDLKPGSYIKLTVADEGEGMEQREIEHIFEPFYTTKEKGKGTGLGLSTVYGIITRAGGWIDVDSSKGKGTRVEIYFPQHEDLTVEVVPNEPEELPGGDETILVVEDEWSVRELTVRNLEALGYKVLFAANGAEALEVFDRHPGTIDLVLSDVVMPLMNGPALMRKLRERQPDLKVLYMSGFSESALVKQNKKQRDAPMLQKPYLLETLASTVRGILDAG